MRANNTRDSEETIGYHGPRHQPKKQPAGEGLIGAAALLFVMILLGGDSLAVAVLIPLPLALLGIWISDRSN